MSDVKIGKTELEELISFVFDVSDAIIASLEDDGRVTLKDAPKFLKPILNSAKAFGGIHQIPAEIADLDDEELQELIGVIRKRFEIKDKRLEAYLENLLVSVLQVVMNVSKIYKLNKSAETV
ncbi:MAG TPA: hypothetical protein PK047_06835 [Saprospiraceae bacterium]|jgi:hypothetical protein|nr:hypothetical protein [Saprospiraceae bacterium]HRP41952.1 hypothetical protein [Saprospiraceae bacterium]